MKTMTAQDDFIEHTEDLMAKMKLKMEAKDSQEQINPRVVAQKDDVIFIKNPDPKWRFNTVLSLMGQSALLISL